MAGKSRVLADTSIQIGKFKYKEIKRYIENLGKDEEVTTSFFVWFEFKVGFVLSLIAFWDYVNASEDVSRAITLWSESFKKRDLKHFIVLEAIIREEFGNSSGNKKKYLRQIETCIFKILHNFFSDIKEPPIGDFRFDDIVRFEIKSREDYRAFTKLCEERSGMIDQRSFWLKYKTELENLISSDDLKKKHGNMHEALSKIKSDIKYAHMVNTNRPVGDAVIAVDTRKGVRILATDESFDTLGAILGKSVERIPNKY